MDRKLQGQVDTLQSAPNWGERKEGGGSPGLCSADRRQDWLLALGNSPETPGSVGSTEGSGLALQTGRGKGRGLRLGGRRRARGRNLGSQLHLHDRLRGTLGCLGTGQLPKGRGGETAGRRQMAREGGFFWGLRKVATVPAPKEVLGEGGDGCPCRWENRSLCQPHSSRVLGGAGQG